MPRYRVSGIVTGTKYLGEFEANSEEEAVGMALNSEEAYVSMCHQCAHGCEDPEIHEANAELIEED